MSSKDATKHEQPSTPPPPLEKGDKKKLTISFVARAGSTSKTIVDRKLADQKLREHEREARERGEDTGLIAAKASFVSSFADIEAADKRAHAPRVIPMQVKNTWQPSHLAEVLSGEAAKSAKATVATAAAVSTVIAGASAGTKTLEQLAAEDLVRAAQGGDDTAKKQQMTTIEMVKQNRVPGIESLKTDEAKFRLDVQSRPSDRLIDYGGMPVGEFGKALMRGMGWTEGGKVGSGRFARVVDPTELQPRASRKGLGAAVAKSQLLDAAKKQGKILKPGEKRPEDPAALLALVSAKTNNNAGADDAQKRGRTLAQRLIPLSALQLRVNSLVLVRAAPHANQYARVVAMPLPATGGKDTDADDGELTLKLNVSEEEVRVRTSGVTVLDANALPPDQGSLEVISP